MTALASRRKEARFVQGPTTEQEARHTVGVRLTRAGGGVSPKAAFDYDIEAAGQWGRFGEGHIRAWTVALAVGYTFDGILTGGLRTVLKANVASGDGDSGDRTLGTFNPLYPNGGYFGGIGLAPLDLVSLQPSVEAQLPASLSFKADVVFFWRHRRADSIYDFPRRPLRAGRTGAARFIGAQPTLEVGWQLSRHVRLSVGYTRFVAGRFLKETGSARTMSYVAAGVTYKF